MEKDRMVCECYGIKISDIENAIKDGAESFEDLESSMRLGVLCGACVTDSKKVIEKYKKKCIISDN